MLMGLGPWGIFDGRALRRILERQLCATWLLPVVAAGPGLDACHRRFRDRARLFLDPARAHHPDPPAPRPGFRLGLLVLRGLHPRLRLHSPDGDLDAVAAGLWP